MLSLILAIVPRQLHFAARDNQGPSTTGAGHDFRSRSRSARDELGGKTLLIVGLGAHRLASGEPGRKRSACGSSAPSATPVRAGSENADDVFSNGRLGEVLPLRTSLPLTCPRWTPQTEGLINAAGTLALIESRRAFLIQCGTRKGGGGRKRALIAGAEAPAGSPGAGLDCTGRGAVAERLAACGTSRMF